MHHVYNVMVLIPALLIIAQECFDAYSETLYRALAVAQRHLLWVKNNDVGVAHPDEIDASTQDLVDHQIPGLLCHLEKLSWKQSYQCEDDMDHYPITENFRRKSRDGRSKKYYRDYVVLQYVKRIVRKMEWAFRYTAEQSAIETTTRGHLVTSGSFTTVPRRRRREHAQNRRRHRHRNWAVTKLSGWSQRISQPKINRYIR